MSRLRTTAGAVGLVVALLGAWELYVDLAGVDSLILPAPHAIGQALVNDAGLLWSNLLVTAEEIVLGILVAAAAAFTLAIAIHFSQVLRRAVYPLLVASQAIPIPIFATVLVLWLGFGILPKLIVIALVSFFSIVVTTMDGLASVDPDLIKLMRTFDASRLEIFRRVELPAALPAVFTGAKIAVAVAVIGAVFAEWESSNAGLGYLFQQSIVQLLPARAFATAFVLCALAVALFALMTVAERRALPWAHQPNQGR